MNYLERILLVAALALGVSGLFLPAAQLIGGVTNFDSLQLKPVSSSDNALEVENSSGTDRLVVDGSGDTTISGSLTQSGDVSVSGAITYTGSCNSDTSYNPGSFSSSTVASTTLDLTDAGLDDLVLATFDSATSSEEWYVEANVANSTGSTTISLVAVPGTTAWNDGLDISTSTLKACAIQF